MRWGRCDFSELTQYTKRLEALQRVELDKLYDECAKALAARLLALVIPITPVGDYPRSSGKMGGTLRRGWGAEGASQIKDYVDTLRVENVGGSYWIEVVNPVEYASYVEFGHRTTNGGWVEGQRMLTISEEHLKSVAPKVLEKLVLKKLKEATNGRG